MDAKNRLTVPAKWLAREEEEFQVAPDPSGQFLMVMTFAELERIEARLMEAASLTPAERRLAAKQLYASARGVTTDKQGRLLLPVDQCQKVGLSGELVLVGSKGRFEVWNKERWEGSVAEHAGLLKRAALEIGL